MGDGRKWFADAALDCKVGKHHWLGESCMVCGEERPYFTCLTCDGNGWSYTACYDPTGQIEKCTVCKGKGKLYSDERRGTFSF